MYFVILITDLHFTFIAYGYTGYAEYGRNNREVLKLMQRLSEQHQSLDNSNQNSSSH